MLAAPANTQRSRQTFSDADNRDLALHALHLLLWLPSDTGHVKCGANRLSGSGQPTPRPELSSDGARA